MEQVTLSKPVTVEDERPAVAARNSLEAIGEQKRMSLFVSEGPAELIQVASSSVTQNLWRRNIIVRSQVIGID